MSAVLHGFLLQLGLIVAIGAQNAFILRQGIKGEHILSIILLCTASDVLAILVGIFGFRTLTAVMPWLGAALRYGGATFLVIYGLLCARAAAKGGLALTATAVSAGSLRQTIVSTLAFTWLNPHFYLDTFGLIGALSVHYPGREYAFGVGAMVGSAVFFFTLGYGARLLRPLLAQPKAWRALDAGIAATMWMIAFGLVAGS